MGNDVIAGSELKAVNMNNMCARESTYEKTWRRDLKEGNEGVEKKQREWRGEGGWDLKRRKRQTFQPASDFNIIKGVTPVSLVHDAHSL